MADQCAWVTLATNDAYCLGALVLAHSLQRVGTKYPQVVMITPSVTPIMKERLSSVFSKIVSVDVLDSKDAAHLALLARPELGITFTKLHCWNLTQYKKCVFLDADTLVLQNCDELFERDEFSAAPDVGWPDCFNSGVFVFQPSNETFDALIKFAKEKGSFDGGDQGLLNQFFSGWASGDASKRLPFLYNVCSTAFYSYLPALKQYGGDTKIMHFIGTVKPWLQKYNWISKTVCDDSYLQGPLQFWWNIFIDCVHSTLDPAMDRLECSASNEARYNTPCDNQSPFPWHHSIPLDLQPPSSPMPHATDFYDPWESYTPAPTTETPTPEAPTPPSSLCGTVIDNEHTNNDIVLYQPTPWYENVVPDEQNEEEEQCVPPGLVGDESTESEIYHDCSINVDSIENQAEKPFVEEVRPRHPYDNFYLNHKTVLDNNGCKRCSHEELPYDPSHSHTPPVDTELDLQAGIAGALSQMTIGASEQGSGVEEHLRRQGWEAGNIDYMGADSFNNIWAKISQTLNNVPKPAESAPPAPPQIQPQPESPQIQPQPKPVPEKIIEEPSKPQETPESEPPKISQETPETVSVSDCDAGVTVPSGESESQAATEEKQEAPEKKEISSYTLEAKCPVKPIEKLVCHLKPDNEAEVLITPENEHEDAASIASSIIASEISSPISAVSPVCSVSTQEKSKDPRPVSLAQIGIFPIKKENEKIDDSAPLKPKSDDKNEAKTQTIVEEEESIQETVKATQAIENIKNLQPAPEKLKKPQIKPEPKDNISTPTLETKISEISVKTKTAQSELKTSAAIDLNVESKIPEKTMPESAEPKKSIKTEPEVKETVKAPQIIEKVKDLQPATETIKEEPKLKLEPKGKITTPTLETKTPVVCVKTKTSQSELKSGTAIDLNVESKIPEKTMPESVEPKKLIKTEPEVKKTVKAPQIIENVKDLQPSTEVPKEEPKPKLEPKGKITTPALETKTPEACAKTKTSQGELRTGITIDLNIGSKTPEKTIPESTEPKKPTKTEAAVKETEEKSSEVTQPPVPLQAKESVKPKEEPKSAEKTTVTASESSAKPKKLSKKVPVKKTESKCAESLETETEKPEAMPVPPPRKKEKKPKK